MKKILIPIVALAFAFTSCNTVKKGMNDAAYQPAGSEVKTVAQEPEKVAEPALEPKAEENGPSIGSSAPKKDIVVKTEEVTIEKISETKSELLDFYVIMGSFSNKENAVKLQNALTAKGSVSEVLRSKAGLFRVSTLGTNNEMAARQLIEKIRIETPEHSDVWLLKTQK